MRAKRIAREPLAQRLHDRDGAADRGLEIERDVMFLGERRERDAMAREQRLVGGDHGLAGRERRLDRASRRIALPAHQLDEHIDPGIGRERHRIGDPAQRLEVDAALLLARAGA